MFGSSMVMSVGAALDRAQSENVPVRLHVAGEWISGRVVNNDGHGVAVLESNGDMCVLRPEAISCVRLPHSEPDARVTPQRAVFEAQAIGA